MNLTSSGLYRHPHTCGRVHIHRPTDTHKFKKFFFLRILKKLKPRIVPYEYRVMYMWSFKVLVVHLYLVFNVDKGNDCNHWFCLMKLIEQIQIYHKPDVFIPLILALERWRHKDCIEFKAILGFKVSENKKQYKIK